MQPGDVITELTCAACGAKQRCGPTQMMQRLADIGMLKRSSDPDLDLLRELFRSAQDRLPCHACDAVGMTQSQVSGDDWDDGAWEEVRPCEGCQKPIPLERLDLFPDATRCAECQASAENGGDQEREFCQHCGSVMTMRLRRSAGPAAYEMNCPNCRR